MISLPRKLERELPFRIFNEDTFDIDIIADNTRLLEVEKYDKKAPLWHIVNIEEYEERMSQGRYYVNRETNFEHRQQQGSTCLSTCLAILTTGLTNGELNFDDEEIIRNIRLKVNTGAPRTWSEFLHRYTKGYRLAYCNTDHRMLRDYVFELVRSDDLFLVSWYSKGHENNHQPDEYGSIGSSHVVIWWKDQIIDTNKNAAMHYKKYFETTSNDERSVKRIFRVVAPWSIHRL